MYDSVAGVFDDQAVDLLVRMADDLGFALQSAEDRRKLQESETRFRALVENSLDAMALLDPEGTILFVTRATSSILGVPAEEFLGSDILEHVHPDDRPGMAEKKRETLARPGLVVPHAARCRHADGGWRDVEGTIVNRLDDPNVRALVMTFRDVTDRKRAQKQLVTLSRAVEQSPVSILITDPEGRIEYVNPRFTAVSGYTLEEVRGGNPRILKSGETPPEVYRQLWETITAGREWRGELHNRKKNGELYWEDALISPILDPEGRVTHFLAVKEDIIAAQGARGSAAPCAEDGGRRPARRRRRPRFQQHPDGHHRVHRDADRGDRRRTRRSANRSRRFTGWRSGPRP